MNKTRIVKKGELQNTIINVWLFVTIFIALGANIIFAFIGKAEQGPIERITELGWTVVARTFLTVATATLVRYAVYQKTKYIESDIEIVHLFNNSINSTNNKIMKNHWFKELDDFNDETNIIEGIRLYKIKCVNKISISKKKDKIEEAEIWIKELSMLHDYEKAFLNCDHKKILELGKEGFDNNFPISYQKVDSSMLFDGINSNYNKKIYADDSDKIFFASTGAAIMFSTIASALIAAFVFQKANEPIQMIFQFISSLIVVISNAFGGWMTGVTVTKKRVIPSLRTRLNHLSMFIRKMEEGSKNEPVQKNNTESTQLRNDTRNSQQM